MHAIGIDIGTTSVCGVLLDAEDGRLLNKRTVTSEAFISTENSWEKIQNVEKLISIAREILDELLDRETLVIGLTGQMHGILYTDEEGKAVSPLYTWQDERGKLPYRDSTYAEHLGSFAGYGNVTDFYNRVNGIRPKEAVSYCTIQDYLGMILCDLKRPVLHISNAASLGCYDLVKKQFYCGHGGEHQGDAGCSVMHELNTRITDEYEVIGEYRGIPVSVAIGDNQASVFSTLADEGQLLLNIGTGSQITVVSDQIITGADIEVRPYVEGKYLVVGAALCGGRAYSLLRDFYKEIIRAAGGDDRDVYGLMDRLMSDVQKKRTMCRQQENQLISGGQENLLTVDTRFAGTRANPDRKGNISGISVDNFTPGELTIGVLNGMVAELFDMYGEMKVSRCGIVGSGNGIRRNKWLIRLIENCFEEKLKVPVHEEEAAYGAALFGLVACGKYRSGAEVQRLISYAEPFERQREGK